MRREILAAGRSGAGAGAGDFAGGAVPEGDTGEVQAAYGDGTERGVDAGASVLGPVHVLLRGTTGERLLDTYGPERSPHVRHFIDVSIGLGRVICVPGLEEATARDAELMAVIADPSLAPAAPPPPRLGPGVLAEGDPQAGLLSIQSRVSYQGVEGLFDDVVGRGWFVLTTATAELALPADAQEVLDRLTGTVLRVGAPGTDSTDLGDLDGRYEEWFAALGDDTVIVRPDFYVYAAIDSTKLAHALLELKSHLRTDRILQA